MGIEMYSYGSPTGVGMTPSKELAEQMNKLRDRYIEAAKKGDRAAMSQILEDEKRILYLMDNENAKAKIEQMERIFPEPQAKAKSPRFIRVVEYYSVPIDTGRGFTRGDVRDRLVYLDIHEVEMISMPRNNGFIDHVIRMKSGREISVSEEDLKLIEAAMRERE